MVSCCLPNKVFRLHPVVLRALPCFVHAVLCVEMASSRPNRVRPNDSSIVETGTDSLMNMHLNDTIIQELMKRLMS